MTARISIPLGNPFVALALATGSFATNARGQLPPEPPQRVDYRKIAFTARPVGSRNPGIPAQGPGFRLTGGVRLISRDPALYSIAWFHGVASTGTLRDGRALVILPDTFGRSPVNEIRIARTWELAGSDRARFEGANSAFLDSVPGYPIIPGYRYIASDSVLPPHYFGLWRRERGREETLLVSFRPATERSMGGYRIVARLRPRLNNILITGRVYEWELTMVSEARVGRPIYILHYALMPDDLGLGESPSVAGGLLAQ